MLDIARQRATETGASGHPPWGDAHTCRSPDTCFDTVVATLSMCGIPDDRAAIAEMYRVMDPGGPLLLLLDHIGSYRLINYGQRLLDKPTPPHDR